MTTGNKTNKVQTRGEPIHILRIMLVFGLQNDGVFQSKILVGKQNTEMSNDGSDEHPRASEYQ